MTEETAIEVVDAEEIVLPDPAEIASSDLINQIAARLWNLIPNGDKGSGSDKLSQLDMPLITETSLSWGCNPLAIGNEYFAFKFQGRLIMMRHYAALLAWAQNKEHFSHKWREWSEKEKIAAGLPAGDFVYDCSILTGNDERAYQERFAMVFGPAIGQGVPFKEALAEAERVANSVGTVGTGRVKHSEVYDDNGNVRRGSAGDIKGWVPGHDRAKIRALRDAIKVRFGTPNRNELMEMRAKALGVSVDQIPATIAEMPDDIEIEAPERQAYYRKIQERVEQVKQARAQMSPEERKADEQETINLLRDPDRDAPIGEDPFPSNGLMDDSYIRDTLAGIGYEPQWHDRLSDLIFKKSIQDLNEAERYNLLEGAKRRMVLNTNKDETGNAIAVAVRIDRIPELSGKGITTIKEAKETVAALTRDLTKSKKRFEEFSL